MQSSQPQPPQPTPEPTPKPNFTPADTDLADLLQNTLHIDIETQTLNDYATIVATKIAPSHKNDSVDSRAFAHSQEVLPEPTKAHRKQLQKVLRALMKERKKTLSRQPVFGYNPLSTVGSRLPQPEDDTVALVQSLRLLNASQPHQRTDEWYAMRMTRITASEFYKVLGTDNARETFAFDKATTIRHPEEVTRRQRTPPTFTEARGWGTIFEEACVMVYSGILRKGAVVEEFGLLPHRTHAFLGASPDGICNEKSGSSEYVGRMLECKAPFSRKLQKNTVKLDYLAQMQGQMEVTGCSSCDYLECRFEVSAHPPNTTTPTQKTTTGEPLPHATGYIVSFPNSPQQLFQYGALNVVDEESVKASVASLQCTDEQRERAMVCYWKLTDYQLLTVYRNPKWFNDVLLPKLQQTWERVQELVSNNEMYEHIMQQKKAKKVAKKTKTTYAFR